MRSDPASQVGRGCDSGLTDREAGPRFEYSTVVSRLINLWRLAGFWQQQLSRAWLGRILRAELDFNDGSGSGLDLGNRVYVRSARLWKWAGCYGRNCSGCNFVDNNSEVARAVVLDARPKPNSCIMKHAARQKITTGPSQLFAIRNWRVWLDCDVAIFLDFAVLPFLERLEFFRQTPKSSVAVLGKNERMRWPLAATCCQFRRRRVLLGFCCGIFPPGGWDVDSAAAKR
ncbi:histone deacetylase 2 [Striga asiatica]|uniref:Histone deacetylase 2 n=1 Tax=Striga asiatica TaxID=4170 RepID=A0A5A7P6K3_STRAF|nr:histone deacetylase 2 [Striga asiatica]